MKGRAWGAAQLKPISHQHSSNWEWELRAGLKRLSVQHTTAPRAKQHPLQLPLCPSPVCVCVPDASVTVGAQFLNNAVLVSTVYQDESAIYGRHNDSYWMLFFWIFHCDSSIISFVSAFKDTRIRSFKKHLAGPVSIMVTIWVRPRILAGNKWHTQVGLTKKRLMKGLFRNVWAKLRETNNEWWHPHLGNSGNLSQPLSLKGKERERSRKVKRVKSDKSQALWRRNSTTNNLEGEVSKCLNLTLLPSFDHLQMTPISGTQWVREPVDEVWVGQPPGYIEG